MIVKNHLQILPRYEMNRNTIENKYLFINFDCSRNSELKCKTKRELIVVFRQHLPFDRPQSGPPPTPPRTQLWISPTEPHLPHFPCQLHIYTSLSRGAWWTSNTVSRISSWPLDGFLCFFSVLDGTYRRKFCIKRYWHRKNRFHEPGNQ
jgi:hypothetical protein